MRYDDLMESRQREREKEGISIATPPDEWGGMRLEQVVERIGSDEVVVLMRRAEWLKPVVQGKRLTLFDRENVRSAWYRFLKVGLDFLKVEAARITPFRRVGPKARRGASSSR